MFNQVDRQSDYFLVCVLNISNPNLMIVNLQIETIGITSIFWNLFKRFTATLK